MKILMVCMGNICRSPMAEGIARDIATSLKCNNLSFDSAGTHAYHIGDPPDKRAQQVMQEHGHDISGLRARAFSIEDFDRFDCIMVADEQNRQKLIAMTSDKKKQDKIIKMLHAHPDQPMADLPDPYYGNKNNFEQVYQLLSTALKHYLVAL